MDDELSCDNICGKFPFGDIFSSSKTSLLNTLDDIQRFMLFYLLEQCSHNDVGMSRMNEQPAVVKALMRTFQKYQHTELSKIQQQEQQQQQQQQMSTSTINTPKLNNSLTSYSNNNNNNSGNNNSNNNSSDDNTSVLKVHTAAQVAMLLTMVNLSTLDSSRAILKQNEGFLRILKVVGGMHRNPSLKSTAETAYSNIVKGTKIKAPPIEVEQSVHKYTRANTLTFYSTCLGLGLSYGLACALRGNMLYGGLKGAQLLSKSLGNAVGTSAGTILLGGFIRDAQAVATQPHVRAYTEKSSLSHSAYTASKVVYMGVGAYVLNAAFPHVFVPAMMANMCLGGVIKGVNHMTSWMDKKRAEKETPQKKLV